MKIFRRIIRFGRPLRHFLPQYFVFTLISVVFGLVNLTMLKPLFDVIFGQMKPEELAKFETAPQFAWSVDFAEQYFYHYLLHYRDTYGPFGTLLFVCIAIVISIFISQLFRYLAGITLSSLQARVIRKVRTAIYEHLTALHIGYFTNERKGDLMSRITNDVQEIERSINLSMKVVFREPLTILIYFGSLFYISTNLTLFSLIILPILGGAVSEIVRRLKKRARDGQESLGRIVNILDESLGGMRIIKAFNARQYINGVFGAETKRYSRIYVSMARKNEMAAPMSQFLGVTVVSVILLYGGNLVLGGESTMDGSSFLLYLAIFTQTITPIKEISKAISGVQRGVVSGERILAVIDTPTRIKEPAQPKPLQDFTDKVVFHKVGFRYDQDPVLKGIDFTLSKGKTIALVGPSGGGKSTIADLLPRFYDPVEGSISLDGQDLRDYHTEDLRRLMGIVTQESILFNDTIFNNIAFGMPEASREAVEQAARIANAHDFISETENGYDTVIGERGSKLSGGQRQRLSIARAVLKNPPILILDEATSALDSESERLVQDALTRLMENRTSLVIAHRLSTIQHADEILVVQQGEIVERGTHDSLITANGVYAKLQQMQSV